MKIGFIISRSAYYRTFGPIIDESLKRGHQVFCLHDYSQPKNGSKGYLFPDLNQTPKFQNGKVVSFEFNTEDEFIEKVFQNNIQVVISLDFIAKHLSTRNKLKEKGVFWVSLQSGFDSLVVYWEFLKYPDRFFIFSHNNLERSFLCLKYLDRTKENNFNEFENSLGDKVKKVGFWLGDQSVISDQATIKKELGIPENKKVVLLFPFPFGSSLKRPWVKYIYRKRSRLLQITFAFLSGNKRFLQQVRRKENDFEVMKAIRKFCDNNNGFLIIKSRKKDPVKKYAVKMADKILYDEEFYPSTTLKCFSVADIFFHFFSTGVMEAVAGGVPSVCIAPEKDDWTDIGNPLFEAMTSDRKLFDWPKVSYLQTIPEIINNLPSKNINDFIFEKNEQIRYLQMFADGKTNGVSESIILEIEKMLKEE